MAETEKAISGMLAMTWFNNVVLPEPDGALKIRSFPLFIINSFQLKVKSLQLRVESLVTGVFGYAGEYFCDFLAFGVDIVVF